MTTAKSFFFGSGGGGGWIGLGEMWVGYNFKNFIDSSLAFQTVVSK